MDFSLSAQQVLMRDLLREYLEREVPFDRIRAQDQSGQVDLALWADLAAQEWLALPFSNDFGGTNGTLVDVALVVEELSRRAARVPFLESIVSGLVIARSGPRELANQLIPGIISGRTTIAPAVLNASDTFDAPGAVVNAGGRLSGEKGFVDYARSCRTHLVTAEQQGETGLWLVEPAPPAVMLRDVSNIGRTPQAAVKYDDVQAQFAGGDAAFRLLLDLGRVLSAVQCLGCAQKALDMAVAYVTNRVQFGRPLGTFQAVQLHCADMAIMVESARYLVYESVWMLDASDATQRRIAIAKAWAGRTAAEVTMLAHLLHGGIGATEEYDSNFFSRRAKERSVAWGSTSECLNLVAASVLEPESWLIGT